MKIDFTTYKWLNLLATYSCNIEVFISLESLFCLISSYIFEVCRLQEDAATYGCPKSRKGLGADNRNISYSLNRRSYNSLPFLSRYFSYIRQINFMVQTGV